MNEILIVITLTLATLLYLIVAFVVYKNAFQSVGFFKKSKESGKVEE